MSLRYYKESPRRQNIFLCGRHLDLRSLSSEDVEHSDWYDWFNDELICRNLQKHYYPNTRALQREFFESMQRDLSKVQLGIVPKDDDRLVGVVSLSDIDLINRNGEFSIVIGDDNFRRSGHSHEALKLLFEHGFFTLNLHKIYGGSVAPLQRWLESLQEEFGFKPEGVWREHAFKDGRYVDVIRVGLLRDDFIEYMKRIGEWTGE